MSVTANLGLLKLDSSDIDFDNFNYHLQTEGNANLDTIDAAISSLTAGSVAFTTKGALSTLTVANNAVECTGTVGFTMYLPAACPSGKTFQIWNNNTAVVTLSGNDVNINGDTALAITPSAVVSVLKATSVFVAY